MLHKVRLKYQMNSVDCGSACLSMVFFSYGCKISTSHIETDFPIGRDGMTVLMMKEIAEKYGFELYAHKYHFDEGLFMENIPLILCTRESHYIVVVRKRSIYTIYDPAKGEKRVAFETIKNNYLDVIVSFKLRNKVTMDNKGVKINFSYNKVKLTAYILLTMMIQVIAVIVPFLTKVIIDKKRYIFDKCQLLNYSIIIILIYMCVIIMNYIKSSIVNVTVMEIFKAITSGLLDKVFRVNKIYFDTSTSEIYFGFLNIIKLFQILTSGIGPIFFDLTKLIICVAIMIRISAMLFFLLLLINIIDVFFILFVLKKQHIENEKNSGNQLALEQELDYILNNMEAVKANQDGDVERIKIRVQYGEFLSGIKRKNQYGNVAHSIIKMANIFIIIFLLIIGLRYVINNVITMGQLMAFIIFAVYFSNPLHSIIIIIPQVSTVVAAMQRLKNIMGFPDEFQYNNIQINAVNSIVLDNIHYKYISAKDNCLNGINLSIYKGEKVVIMGESGSGKTTLIKIIANRLCATSGNILINAYDISVLNKEVINQRIAVVNQNAFLAGSTIRESIDIFHNMAEEEIFTMLDIVGLGDDIRALPLLLSTYIGKNGQNISSGQKQRIAIASAIARKPDVIILDEATSNLDFGTEMLIFNNLKDMEITQIIVSSRLQVMPDADLVIVLDKGKVLEQRKGNERNVY